MKDFAFQCHSKQEHENWLCIYMYIFLNWKSFFIIFLASVCSFFVLIILVFCSYIVYSCIRKWNIKIKLIWLFDKGET